MDISTIDITALIPGTELTQQQCEQIVGVRRYDDPSRYAFELMRLQSELGRAMRRLGIFHTIVCDDGSLVVLEAAEAMKYNANAFDNALAKARRATKRMRSIDVGKLTDEQLKEFDKTVIRQSRIVQGFKVRTNLEAMLKPVQRTTPVS